MIHQFLSLLLLQVPSETLLVKTQRGYLKAEVPRYLYEKLTREENTEPSSIFLVIQRNIKIFRRDFVPKLSREQDRRNSAILLDEIEELSYLLYL